MNITWRGVDVCQDPVSLSLSFFLFSLSLSIYLPVSLWYPLSPSYGLGSPFTYTMTPLFLAFLFFLYLLVGFLFLLDSLFQMFEDEHRLVGAGCGSAERGSLLTWSVASLPNKITLYHRLYQPFPRPLLESHTSLDLSIGTKSVHQFSYITKHS